MPSFNTLQRNFKNLENDWFINIKSYNIKTLNKINITLNKDLMKKQLILLKKNIKILIKYIN